MNGPDNLPYEHSFSIGVTGELKPTPELRANRRFEQAADELTYALTAPPMIAKVAKMGRR